MTAPAPLLTAVYDTVVNAVRHGGGHRVVRSPSCRPGRPPTTSTPRAPSYGRTSGAQGAVIPRRAA